MLAALALAADAGVAQTPATSVGLGYPTPPVDGRAAALGGAGVGLLGGTFTIGNPADLVEFSEASLSISAAPEGVSPEGAPAGAEDPGRSRFSTLRAVVPLGDWAVSVGFGSELDQDWKFTDRDTLDISTGRFPFEERRENDGGVSTVDLSVARSVGPLSVGVSYQRLTGSLRQDLERRFEASVEGGVSAPSPVVQSANWGYGGWRLKGGLGLEIAGRVRLGGVYAWSGDLEAERDSVVTLAEEPDGPSDVTEIPMPASAGVGASALLTDDWLLAVAGGWSQWSEADGSLDGERARDVHWGGGGVEFRGLQVASFPIELRVGGRWRELPFSLPGRGAASETAATVGLGTEVAAGTAAVDVGLEVGSRGELARTGFEESFRRFTVTATIRR